MSEQKVFVKCVDVEDNEGVLESPMTSTTPLRFLKQALVVMGGWECAALALRTVLEHNLGLEGQQEVEL